MDIYSYMEESFQNYKELTALECWHSQRSYTYEEVRRGISNWASLFSSCATDNKPPPVVFLCSNSIEANVVALGAVRAGSLAHMMNYSIPIDVLIQMVRESEADIIISEEEVLDIVNEIVEKIDRRFHIFTIGINDYDEMSVERIIKETTIAPYQQTKKVDPDSPAFVFFTSGTTGKPKGIVVPHRAILVHADLFKEIFEAVPVHGDDQPIYLVLGKLPHQLAYNLNLACIRTGGKVVVLKGLDHDEVISATQKYKLVSICGRVSLLNSISTMKKPKEALGSLRMLLNIGSAITSETCLRLKDKFGENFVLKNIYGSIEAGLIGISSDSANPCQMDLLPQVEVRIRDLATNEGLGHNQLGEICSRTPGKMVAYFKNPGATSEVLDHDGWVRTGDSGYTTENNQLCFYERFKDLLQIHGKLISPLEIESAFLKHPRVKEVGVTGLPNAKAGELPMAFVVQDDAKQVSEEELKNFANEQFTKPEYKVKIVEFVKSLPKNHMGKIERKYLRKLAWKSL